MIQTFRRFFQSKVGIFATLAFLGLIAFAFASSDVANTGTFGGVSGGNRVAVVGDEKIATSDLSRSVTSALDGMRRENPTLSMPAFIEQGGLERVLDQLLERAAISGFGKKYGLRAGTNLVNSEIIGMPAFRGADGNFDQNVYNQALIQQRLTDGMVRDDLGQGLLAQQVLVPAAFGARAPDKFALQYASLLKETRTGAIGVVPSAAFAPTKDPSDAKLKAFYETSRGDYIRPERRIIRYASFGDAAIGNRAEPTDQEIAARYGENRERYAQTERRTITQMIVPTEQAANSIRERVRGGVSIEAAAREASLQTSSVGPVTSAQLSSQSSAAVAKAVFEADRGKIAAPARSGLGFHVARVDSVERIAGKSLEQARTEIETTLREEKRRRALGDLAADVEDQVESGVSLSEIAEELGLEVTATKPITAAGTVYGAGQERAPEILAPALQTAFQMDENDPQLAEVQPGQTFLVFEVTKITESASAPLAEIRDRVIGAWKLSEGSKLAKAAADRIRKRVDEGTPLAAAASAEKVTLPPVDAINLNREQLAAQGQQVPPALALLFSMAEGTTKRLQAPRDAGWFIVRLDDIEAGTIPKDDPLFERTKAELSQLIGREYGAELRRAIQTEIGIERNAVAVEAVRKQLVGEN